MSWLLLAEATASPAIETRPSDGQLRDPQRVCRRRVVRTRVSDHKRRSEVEARDGTRSSIGRRGAQSCEQTGHDGTAGGERDGDARRTGGETIDASKG
ncbi:hypothetical protein PCL_10767 [Purpureocillium lilacinum]|uniref:Uncharacterized protein n=1 Tax=Purpureocillium lilacinum TaxID=33203 RepID=A0A2U3EC89_PURLI|nr:hypothetical protein PCL_10767 [Purpureocillium lilacinum]